MRRFVVTAIDMLHALGEGCGSFDAIAGGACGIAPITLFDASGYETAIAAEVKGFDAGVLFGRKQARRMSRFIQMGLFLARRIAEEGKLAGLNNDRIGVIGATGFGGIDVVQNEASLLCENRKISPFFIPSYIPALLGGQIAIELGLHGPNLSVSTACAAGTHALIEACKTLAFGQCDAMLVVGADAAITSLGIRGFLSMNAMSKENGDFLRAMKPFDAKRSGFVMGEGAGALLVETYESAVRRDAVIEAEIIGFGESGDAYHMTAPDPSGRGFEAAMHRALAMAGLERVDYVNAHGTATPLNDLAEAAAIYRLMGSDVPVSSIKAQIGHTMGAAGAIEAVVSILAMQKGVLPPLINYRACEEAMPPIDLVANRPREVGIQTAMSCNFGFGGVNAAIVFRSLEAAGE